MDKQEIIDKRNRYLKIIHVLAKICNFFIRGRGKTRRFIKKKIRVDKFIDTILFHHVIRGLNHLMYLLHKKVPKDVLIVYDGTLENRDKNDKIYDDLHTCQTDLKNFRYYCLEKGCLKYIKGTLKWCHEHFISECYGHSFSCYERYWSCCDEHNEKAAS